MTKFNGYYRCARDDIIIVRDGKTKEDKIVFTVKKKLIIKEEDNE